MTPTDVRVQLHERGYAPLPLAGKKCLMTDWPSANPGPQDIKLWLLRWPGWTNTGALCAFMPTLDLDIFDQEAACIAEDIVRRRYEGRGRVLVRIGKPPKRAIPFRTNEPFKKIQADLIRAKLEFLGDGQQIAVAGIHPDTRQPYRWQGEALWQVPWDELPYIRESAARALIEEIGEMLCREFGYHEAERATAPVKPHTQHGALVAITGELPKALYFRMCALMPSSSGRDRRRVRELLNIVVRTHEGRNDTLNRIAFIFRELIGAGVIAYDAAESLLLDAATLNGYVQKDGLADAVRTIRSGLGSQSQELHVWCEGEEAP
jgi:hypothetical protein